MQQRVITENLIKEFRKYLCNEEKSKNTEQKYIRDVRTFAAFADDKKVCKEIVIKYKEYLLGKNYAVRSINSMLASLNSLFSFLSWNDCKVKAVRLQKGSTVLRKRN